MKEKVLITSALLYANGTLHFGHFAGAYLPADCFARFKRLQGDDVHFISGSDEYGVAVTISAEIEGRSPKEQVDHYHEINKELFQRLNISFDHYSRTTCKEHAPIVQSFFLNLLEAGLIEEKVTEQLYSDQEKRFLADRYVVGTCPKCGYDQARGDECPKCAANYEATDLKDPKSKLTGSTLRLKETKHWFFCADKLRKELLSWLGKKDWRSNVVNFVKPYIEDLRPRAITRDMDWGVKVPLEGSDGKVLYVWFDAPIGYISASQEWANQRGAPESWRDYWCDEKTRHVEFIGKDNIVFHSVFFPAMVMGNKEKFKLVDELPANEFLNLEGKQFSKSSGWYIDLKSFIEKYPVDALRYTIAANAPESCDSEFTFRDFQMRVNVELVGKFANFVHRTLTFIQNRMEGVIPHSMGVDEDDSEFLESVSHKVNEIAKCYDQFHVRKATTLIMELASIANGYFDHKKPWVLVREKELTEQLNTTIYCCLMAARALALVSYPVIPETAEKIWKMIGMEYPLAKANWKEVMETEMIPGTELPKPELLFEKIDDETIEAELEKLETACMAHTKRDVPPLKETITFDQFQDLDLRVGVVLEAEKVPKSSKLLKLSVDIGSEKRTVVSGIAKHFPDGEGLVGRRVIFVANLKPAKIMGIESEGMVLAAADEALFELPRVEDLPPGSVIS